MERGHIAPLRGTTALLAQQSAGRYIGAARQKSSFCRALTELDIDCIGKGGLHE